jgi:hypothetical protein
MERVYNIFSMRMFTKVSMSMDSLKVTVSIFGMIRATIKAILSKD